MNVFYTNAIVRGRVIITMGGLRPVNLGIPPHIIIIALKLCIKRNNFAESKIFENAIRIIPQILPKYTKAYKVLMKTI